MTELRKSRAGIAKIVEALQGIKNQTAIDAARVCFDVGHTEGAMAAVDFLLAEKAISEDKLSVIQELFKQLVAGTQNTHNEFFRKYS